MLRFRSRLRPKDLWSVQELRACRTVVITSHVLTPAVILPPIIPWLIHFHTHIKINATNIGGYLSTIFLPSDVAIHILRITTWTSLTRGAIPTPMNSNTTLIQLMEDPGNPLLGISPASLRHILLDIWWLQNRVTYRIQTLLFKVITWNNQDNTIALAKTIKHIFIANLEYQNLYLVEYSR